MAIAFVTEKDFEREVIRSPIPVLVAFVAAWSAPCKSLAPVLESYAVEVEGKAKVVKVDSDAAPRLADMLRVQNLPTLYVFHQGRPVNAVQGASKREQLESLRASLGKGELVVELAFGDEAVRVKVPEPKEAKDTKSK